MLIIRAMPGSEFAGGLRVRSVAPPSAKGIDSRPTPRRLNRKPLVGSIWLWALMALPGIAQNPVADMPVTEIYEKACASCHGARGAGLAPDSPLLPTFEVEPADLTDPMFSSGEPAADWFLVIKYGGKPLGLSGQMPAYGQVFSDFQIDELVAYIKAFANTEGYPPGDLNFLRGISTIKAFPEDEALLLGSYESDGSVEALTNTLYHARRIGRRAQVEAKLSHLARESVSGLHEVEVGFKYALGYDLESQTLWTVGVEAEIPLHDRETESDQIVPYFAFAKGLGDSLTLQGNLLTHLPADDASAGDIQVRGILHWMRSPWPRAFFPGIEGKVNLPYESAGQVGFSLTPQTYFGLSKGGHVALVVGVEIPVSGPTFDYKLHWFLLWDLADGAFWEGW